ncbi:hypothetical protein DICVIV_00673 [Dictyocaulus viviparus]|uniref:Uncharacterized protein n=1 Tax=Dictyocaulus viviparus TaxID=29172 RepID=A0A0D8Y8Y7_DICVI|nr:hypothetical protein DICVIV_00673 [Dictyocaulus viviparus]
MEQIKASIEADKMKPKKEIKARISLMLQQTRAPPTQNENTIDDKMPDTPRRVLKQPLKTVNAMPPTPPKTERPKRERKPLYVPPPPKERKEVKTSTPLVRNGVEKPVDSPNVSKITAEETPPKRPNAAKSKPSSLINEVKLRNKAHIGSKVNGMVRAEISNVEKLQRLQCVSRAFEALCVMITRSEIESARLRSELLQANENIAHQQEIVGELKAHLSEREKLHLEDIERYRSHNEQVARSQAEALERTKERYEQQLSEKVKEAETALEDERTRHEAELEAMSRRHQKVVTSLDEKIAEGEKTIEQLMVDKKTLQKALANDSDQRNQMLTKEINSLQTALEFKSCEMKELRQKYQQVALRVEEIPVKELEITKLKHKVTELKQALDQKLTYEKMLLHQNEELKRQHMAIEEERESMQRNFDVMIYRYGNGEEVEQSPKQKSGKVQFRSRSSTSDRPQSNARLSQTSICDMDRSSDRDSLVRSTISMYASQVQLPENHDDDVIYAPDEIITSNVARGGFSTLSKRIDNSSTCYPENITRSVNGAQLESLTMKKIVANGDTTQILHAQGSRV